MAPRISIAGSSWASLTLPTRPRLDPLRLPFRQFTSRSSWRAADTYADRQREAQQLARLSRESNASSSAAAKRRDAPPASPIYGEPTQFVVEFDQPAPREVDILTGEALSAGEDDALADKLNFRLDADQVDAQLERSRELTLPVPPRKPDVVLDLADSERERLSADYQAQMTALTARHEAEHAQATEALRRILRLDMGSSKDRKLVNMDKCIATFGRHNTDHTLPARNGGVQIPKDRAGQDVGSSEVQIAIMTVKIRNLARRIESSGNHDYHNKRNLRLLVHKRAKLMKYLRKKERGGPRWQHLVQTLGLTDVTWKGEIQF